MQCVSKMSHSIKEVPSSNTANYLGLRPLVAQLVAKSFSVCTLLVAKRKSTPEHSVSAEFVSESEQSKASIRMRSHSDTQLRIVAVNDLCLKV